MSVVVVFCPGGGFELNVVRISVWEALQSGSIFDPYNIGCKLGLEICTTTLDIYGDGKNHNTTKPPAKRTQEGQKEIKQMSIMPTKIENITKNARI